MIEQDPFASIDPMRMQAVEAACGCRCDARTVVYWHCKHGVTALCPKCSHALEARAAQRAPTEVTP